jgi:hypothetical protein
MSINVETVGDVLMVQHYVAEVHERAYCRTVSISDSITAAGRTKVQVVWGLSAKKLDDHTCEYSNREETPNFAKSIKSIERNALASR